MYELPGCRQTVELTPSVAYLQVHLDPYLRVLRVFVQTDFG